VSGVILAISWEVRKPSKKCRNRDLGLVGGRLGDEGEVLGLLRIVGAEQGEPGLRGRP
jgi:hypothetical protein